MANRRKLLRVGKTFKAKAAHQLYAQCKVSQMVRRTSIEMSLYR